MAGTTTSELVQVFAKHWDYTRGFVAAGKSFGDISGVFGKSEDYVSCKFKPLRMNKTMTNKEINELLQPFAEVILEEKRNKK